MIVNQNIKILIQHLNLNVNQFAKNLGLDRPDVIYNIVQEKTKASTDILELILQKYENVSMNWLLSGKGNMFVGGEVGLRVVKESNTAVPLVKENNPPAPFTKGEGNTQQNFMIEQQNRLIEHLQREIQRLQRELEEVKNKNK